MNQMLSNPGMLNTLVILQRGEITEHEIYTRIAKVTGDLHNREVLERIANEEYEHSLIWKKYTERDVSPDPVRVWYYYLLARVHRSLSESGTIRLIRTL
jgi:demethoxyubiquinone hydroxylase (CLK1/Coq7/Cat5 family)